MADYKFRTDELSEYDVGCCDNCQSYVPVTAYDPEGVQVCEICNHMTMPSVPVNINLARAMNILRQDVGAFRGHAMAFAEVQAAKKQQEHG